MKVLAFALACSTVSAAWAQCIGWFPAPWAPLRPDPAGAEYPERSLWLDLAQQGPAELVLVNTGAGYSGSTSVHTISLPTPARLC